MSKKNFSTRDIMGLRQFNSYILDDTKSPKLKQGFHPLNQTDYNKIQKQPRMTMSDISRYYDDSGAPRLFHKQKDYGDNLNKIAVNDYIAFQEASINEQVQEVKRQHKYKNSSSDQQALSAYIGEKEFDKQVESINEILDKLIGVDKKQKIDIRNDLLKEMIGGKVVQKSKTKLKELIDANTGKNYENNMRAINESVIEEPDLGLPQEMTDTDFMTQFEKIKQRKEKRQKMRLDKGRKSRQIKRITKKDLERMISSDKTEGNASREEEKKTEPRGDRGEEQVEGLQFLTKLFNENLSNIDKFGITELKQLGKLNNVKGYSTWKKEDRQKIAKSLARSNVRLHDKNIGRSNLRRFSS